MYPEIAKPADSGDEALISNLAAGHVEELSNSIPQGPGESTARQPAAPPRGRLQTAAPARPPEGALDELQQGAPAMPTAGPGRLLAASRQIAAILIGAGVSGLLFWLLW